MRFHKIKLKFPDFGINKIQELSRLIYEISRIEKAPIEDILDSLSPNSFEAVKKELLKRRFPYSSTHDNGLRPYLPKININPANTFDKNNSAFNPKKILVEKSASSFSLANRFKEFFPAARYIEIPSLKTFIQGHRQSGITDYNKRRDMVFITNDKYDFFKKCPCTKKAVGCGYNIFNLGFGCIFDCTYCYLQEYANVPGLVFPANIERFFDEFRNYKRRGMRIGTGEFSDSLMLDHITEYSQDIIDFFSSHRDVIFEFKTKSENISNILNTKHSGNIVISWSLNPQAIIDDNEFFTASFNKRIESAKRCVDSGYKVGFHFDPVIYFSGWKDEYEKTIDLLFSSIKPRHISWISIGTFRFRPELKPIIENRFPDNEILNGELLLGYDNKLRYPDSMRLDIYNFLLSVFKRHAKNLPIYLCMEESSIWKNLNLPNFTNGAWHKL